MTSAELIPSSSLASPPSSPRLPVELLLRIVDLAAGNPDMLDYTTLRHLCLASKSILPVARSALYRDITITFYDMREETSNDQAVRGTLEWFEAFEVCYDGHELETSLAGSPHLGTLVKSVAFRLALKNIEAGDAPAIVLKNFSRLAPSSIPFACSGKGSTRRWRLLAVCSKLLSHRSSSLSYRLAKKLPNSSSVFETFNAFSSPSRAPSRSRMATSPAN